MQELTFETTLALILAKDPRYFSRPDRALFQDIRRYFPIASQAKVNWAITQGIGAAVGYILPGAP